MLTVFYYHKDRPYAVLTATCDCSRVGETIQDIVDNKKYTFLSVSTCQ